MRIPGNNLAAILQSVRRRGRSGLVHALVVGMAQDGRHLAARFAQHTLRSWPRTPLLEAPGAAMELESKASDPRDRGDAKN